MTPWPTLPALPPAADRPAFIKPFVEDDGEVLSLHFTVTELQSRMSRKNPWQLEVDYTRTMMGFLMLSATPLRIAMIGLGGGSLAKFCYRELPASQITAIENNPHVIALRRKFEIPDDDARFKVVEADGAAYVAAHAAAFDVLLVDGFDQDGQAASLCTQAFYDSCFQALLPTGVLVVNLHHDDADYPLLAARIQRSFAGNAVEVPAPEKSNCIVFASCGEPISPRRIAMQRSLAQLGSEARLQLKAEFARVAWSMKDLADDSAANGK